MIRIKIYLPERMVKDLEEMKRELQIPVAEIVRRAIDEYIERYRSSSPRKEQGRKNFPVSG